MRPVNDYSHIEVDWFLGDVGDVSDYIIHPTAMPKEFDPRKARLFLEYMQTGMTERQAMLETPVVPGYARSWIRGSNASPNNFAVAYIRAREQQIHAMAQETVDISDGTDRLTSKAIEAAASEIKNPFRPDGNTPDAALAAIKSMLNKSGERIASRRWYASKVLPMHYGDSMKLEHTGNDKKPVSLNIKNLTTEQLEKLAQFDEELNGGKA